jgi:hypothetical protein
MLYVPVSPLGALRRYSTLEPMEVPLWGLGLKLGLKLGLNLGLNLG